MSNAANLKSKSSNLLKLINRLILEKHYDGIPLLLKDKRNTEQIRNISTELMIISKKYLNEEYLKNDCDLYNCGDIILQALAQYANPNEVSIELLEMIEDCGDDSEKIFTSVLKALQICLWHLKDNRKRTINIWDYSFRSIALHVKKLKTPPVLTDGHSLEEERLLEKDISVYTIIQRYAIIVKFFSPHFEYFLKQPVQPEVFRSIGKTKRNVWIVFFFELLGDPLASLTLRRQHSKNVNVAQNCAIRLVNSILKLWPDPFFFLSLIEKKAQQDFRRHTDSDDESYLQTELSNIFLYGESMTLKALSVFYYLLFKGGLLPQEAPKIYNFHYLFEMCVHLIVHIFEQTNYSMYHKGIQLTQLMLENPRLTSLSSSYLDVPVFTDLCRLLCNIMIYSPVEEDRKDCLNLLRRYIYKFDDEGRFYLFKNLFTTVDHDGLYGFVITTYKNIIAEKLKDPDPISHYFRGPNFHTILMKYIFKLDKSVEPSAENIFMHTDKIVAALNALRFFSMGDENNRLGFRDVRDRIKENFLQPLRKVIDLSRAHYKSEEKRVRDGEDVQDECGKIMLLTLMTGEKLPTLTKAEKLTAFSNFFLSFDLVESLLARANECIDN